MKFLKNVLWKYLHGPACNCTFLLCACNCWMTWICFSNHELVRHESLFTFLTAEKQATQATASSFCRSCSCNSACRWQVVSSFRFASGLQSCFPSNNIQHTTKRCFNLRSSTLWECQKNAQPFYPKSLFAFPRAFSDSIAWLKVPTLVKFENELVSHSGAFVALPAFHFHSSGLFPLSLNNGKGAYV